MNEILEETYIGKDGRVKVTLKNYDTGVEEECDLASLVARTFIPNPPQDLTKLPRFKDGNVENCSSSNLYWD